MVLRKFAKSRGIDPEKASADVKALFDQATERLRGLPVGISTSLKSFRAALSWVTWNQAKPESVRELEK